ncbi:hypothetical protein Pla52n_18610 [Stieleria varia]|uniref:Uncharacterized protein n=1 Tax=Stieleria varia TaxID=2528005 RepID=A0A5C6B3T7_9BACT|nr:hypothetical protein Pla52n_18610 [Stieleria varia]
MKFASQRTVVVVLVSAVSVFVLGTNAFAQSGSRGGYAAPAMSSSSVPTYSAPASAQAYQQPASMVTGAGCASGNCAGATVVSNAPVYHSYSQPTFSAPVPQYGSPSYPVYSSGYVSQQIAYPNYSSGNSNYFSGHFVRPHCRFQNCR